MTLLDRLNGWRARGKVSDDQYRMLSAIVRRERFSIYFELNALLYLGVLSFIAGLGWTIKTYFAQLGDSAILFGLSTLFIISLGYCFQTSKPFARTEVESANYVIDYVLYLSCLVFSAEIGYLEMRYHLLAARWDLYLLGSSLLFFFLAYRFDNRFVLSLALSTLAAWFGVKITNGNFYHTAPLRPYALAFGITTALAGLCTSQINLKKHFLSTYLHIAANVLFWAALSGVFEHTYFFWSLLLTLFAVASGIYGFQTRQFGFVAYGVLYGYFGISSLIMRHMGHHVFASWLWFYYLISGGLVIVTLIKLSRRFEAAS